jgi:hypothetical protein
LNLSIRKNADKPVRLDRGFAWKKEVLKQYEINVIGSVDRLAVSRINLHYKCAGGFRRIKICITRVARRCELMDIEWAFDSASCATTIQPSSLFLDWGSARNGTNRSKFRFLNAGTHRRPPIISSIPRESH